ncbi:hypothetical protein [Agromyces larvae]|uniref:Uncharacterized protein n=1 Tax=Agromyces larvae TaxID=2929802 RepID=A0ABY4C5B1_9MICO|nr:hypothetical protein [Agromyces larvae]UOE45251.1 hypothetical protein MTO99_05630 [Agromyces larvae]
MVSKKDEFEYQTVRRMKDLQRYLEKGWELVESSGKENWVWGSDYKALLRRPNPKYVGSASRTGPQPRSAPTLPPGEPVAAVAATVPPAGPEASPLSSPSSTSQPPAATTGPQKPWYMKWWVWAIGVFLLIGVIGYAFGGGRDGTPAATSTPTPSPKASEAETESPASPAPEPSPAAAVVATNEEVVSAFQGYLSERASAGVVIAKAVSSVTFDAGVVRVVFDPALAGLDTVTFQSLSPFDNLAEFAGTPIAFADDEVQHLRTAVTSVETLLVDGASLGTLTSAELYKIGTGSELPAGG